MAKKIILILFFLFVSCSGQGTEVLNTLNPNETTSGKKFESVYYTVVFDLPEGWDYLDYTDGDEQGDEAFEDTTSEDTETLAYFFKDDLACFTVFASQLADDETILDFVRARRPTGEIQSQEADSNGETATLLFYQQDEIGERGGYVFDLYLNVEDEVLWIRGELTGTYSEREQSWNEIGDFFESVGIES